VGIRSWSTSASILIHCSWVEALVGLTDLVGFREQQFRLSRVSARGRFYRQGPALLQGVGIEEEVSSRLEAVRGCIFIHR